MPMDSDVIQARTSEVRASMRELERLASKPFENLGIDERYSMRYNLIVLVESMVALCIHVVAEAYGYTPVSYRDAIYKIAGKLGLTCVDDLGSLVGLRNLLIHRYWEIRDDKVYEEIRHNFKCVEQLLNKVEAELQK